MRNRVMVSIILALLILLTAAPAQTLGNGSLSDKVICLDPGHGGTDPGADYDDGTIYLEEADINLDVAYGLKALLEELADAKVVMTRTTNEEYLTNSDRYTFANKEEADILVSIHTNSVFLNPETVDGSMALYFHDDDKVLAQAIYDVMLSALSATAPNPDQFRDFGLEKFAARILMSSEMPATILEPLCMSHPVEADWLTVTIHLVDDKGVVVLDEEGNPTPNPNCIDCRRAQIAQAIYEGILEYDFSPVEDDGGGPCDEPPCGKEKTR